MTKQTCKNERFGTTFKVGDEVYVIARGFYQNRVKGHIKRIKKNFHRGYTTAYIAVEGADREWPVDPYDLRPIS